MPNPPRWNCTACCHRYKLRCACRAGLLKTLGANKNAPLPVRLFEISDVVLLSDGTETGARNERRLAAAVCAKENTFETIHGFLNRVMDVLGVPAHVPGLGISSVLALPRFMVQVANTSMLATYGGARAVQIPESAVFEMLRR